MQTETVNKTSFFFFYLLKEKQLLVYKQVKFGNVLKAPHAYEHFIYKTKKKWNVFHASILHSDNSLSSFINAVKDVRLSASWGDIAWNPYG